MADEAMSLRLPKPVLGSEIRSDFLNFSPDRRWDLLAFIKSDEVEEIKSCDVGPDGHRYYLVHWKESWKPESSLVYCEKLLQDFWSKRSMLNENITPTLLTSSMTDTLSQPDSDDELAPSEINNSGNACDGLTTSHTMNILASPDISQSLTTCDKLYMIEAGEHTLEPVMNDTIHVDGEENNNMDTIPASDGVLEDCCSTDQNSKGKLTRSNEKCIAEENDGSFVVVVDTSECANIKSCDHTCHVPTVSTETCDEITTQLQMDEINNDVDVTEKQSPVVDHTDDRDVVLNADDNDVEHEMNVATDDISPVTGSTNNDIDSPSKKGAPKRKARIPRQSMHSLGAKACLVKRKEKIKKAKEKIKKIKEKNKGPKILKTVSTIINSKAAADETDCDITNDESSNLKCMVCDKLLSTQQSLMKHLLTHNNNHTCPICQKTFKSTHFLRHHMDIHNASYQYSCPVCEKKFKFKNNMLGHLRKHNMEKKFECEVCQKKFIGRYNLREHMKSHSDSRPFACDFCTKSYKDRGALNKHLLTHQEKRVECQICKRAFTNLKQVNRHMQFHYSWPGDSFKRKTNIGPDGEKTKFKCPHCDKMFNHYSNMNAHVHKQHEEKKIRCTTCSKTFAYQYELREHMFIHLGAQGSKFKCQFCHKSFQRSTTLKNHERTTHLGIKRFKCEICGKLFGTKFNMKVHIEKLHSDNGSVGDEKHVHAQTSDDLISSSFSTTGVHTGLPPISSSLSGDHPHSLLRAISTSDIIRNAISHIPELSYFPPLPGHPQRYQFYGMAQTDFTIHESTMG